MKKVTLLLTLIFTFKVMAKEDEFKDMYKCFSADLITVKANYERVQWPNSEWTNVCNLSFRINSTSPAYFYYTRSWRDPEYCKKFINEWNILRKKNKKICIAARLDSPDLVSYKGKDILQQSAPWEIIRSGNWCRSYFIRDNCD